MLNKLFAVSSYSRTLAHDVQESSLPGDKDRRVA